MNTKETQQGGKGKQGIMRACMYKEDTSPCRLGETNVGFNGNGPFSFLLSLAHYFIAPSGADLSQKHGPIPKTNISTLEH